MAIRCDGRLETSPDIYTFTGTEGEHLYVWMQSAAFDPLLRLLDENGNELLVEDNNGPDYDSFINGFVLPYDGSYTLVADKWGDNVGRYSLWFDSDQHRMQALAFGDELRGELILIFPNFYTFSGEEGDHIYLSMSSAAFDAFIAIYDEDGNELIVDDNNGVDYDAFISNYELPWDGDFTVVARSTWFDSTGRYDLVFDSQNHRITDLPLGEEVDGELENLIPYFYTITAEENDWFYVWLSAPTFDPFLIIYDEDGNELIVDDNNGPDYDAYIDRYVFPWDGTFIVVVKATWEGTGRFTLLADTFSHRAQALESGAIVAGELTSPIPDLYTFEGSEGQTVTVSMTSPTFDAFVLIFDSEEHELIVDDNNGDDYNALIQSYALPADDTYVIIARSPYNDQTGEYELSFSVQ